MGLALDDPPSVRRYSEWSALGADLRTQAVGCWLVASGASNGRVRGCAVLHASGTGPSIRRSASDASDGGDNSLFKSEISRTENERGGCRVGHPELGSRHIRRPRAKLY